MSAPCDTRPGVEYWELNEDEIIWVEAMEMYAIVTVDEGESNLRAILIPAITHPDIAERLEASGQAMSFMMERNKTYELVIQEGVYSGPAG